MGKKGSVTTPKFSFTKAVPSLRQQAKQQVGGGAHQDAPTATAPEQSTARPAAVSGKLSSKLLGLKFMQRAVQKDVLEDKAKETAKRLREEQFVSEAWPARGCVVIQEDAPLMGGTSGRMSFGSFNPDVERVNGEYEERAALADAEAAGQDDVSAAEMAAVALQNKRPRRGGPPLREAAVAAVERASGAGTKERAAVKSAGWPEGAEEPPRGALARNQSTQVKSKRKPSASGGALAV